MAQSRFKPFLDWGKENMTVLVGILCIFLGAILIALVHTVLINILVFAAGILLVYYGMKELKIKPVTDVIDGFLAKLKK